MNQETKTDMDWQGRTPLAEVTLEGRGAEGRMVLYATPVGMFISVRIGGRGLHRGAVYRLEREIGGKREACSWFPPLYEKEGVASRQIMTQKVSPGELWGSHFLVLDQSRVALRGSM